MGFPLMDRKTSPCSIFPSDGGSVGKSRRLQFLAERNVQLVECRCNSIFLGRRHGHGALLLGLLPGGADGVNQFLRIHRLGRVQPCCKRTENTDRAVRPAVDVNGGEVQVPCGRVGFASCHADDRCALGLAQRVERGAGFFHDIRHRQRSGGEAKAQRRHAGDHHQGNLLATAPWTERTQAVVRLRPVGRCGSPPADASGALSMGTAPASSSVAWSSARMVATGRSHPSNITRPGSRLALCLQRTSTACAADSRPCPGYREVDQQSHRRSA